MLLSEYLSSRGSQTKLAHEINAQPQLVWQWSTGVRKVPIERCMSIERATAGVVTRKDLRPDDYREIWPELATAEDSKPDQPQAHTTSGQAAIKTEAHALVIESARGESRHA